MYQLMTAGSASMNASYMTTTLGLRNEAGGPFFCAKNPVNSESAIPNLISGRYDFSQKKAVNSEKFRTSATTPDTVDFALRGSHGGP